MLTTPTFLKSLLALPLCAATLLPLAAGCQHSDAPILARGEQYEPSWLTMGSEDLRRSTMVGSPQQVYDGSNILFVTVPVRNTTDKQLYVRYKYFFYDEAGREINQITDTVTIPARGQVEVKGNATNNRAGGRMPFRLELTYPRVN